MNKIIPCYPGSHHIDTYGNGGFRFAKKSHRGSLICVPSGIFTWNMINFDNITFADLSSIYNQLVKPSLLLVGTGKTHAYFSSKVNSELIKAGINLETMSTGAACRTYNIMLNENRPVAAALLVVR